MASDTTLGQLHRNEFGGDQQQTRAMLKFNCTTNYFGSQAQFAVKSSDGSAQVIHSCNLRTPNISSSF